MLAKRIIPSILVRGEHAVKGDSFAGDRVVGLAFQTAYIMAKRGVDELLILDITATKEDRPPNYKLIEKLTRDTTVPVTVGGGIQTTEHVQKLLNAGADKVCIGCAKVDLLQKISKKFGKQCVAVTIDYSELAYSSRAFNYEIPVGIAKEMEILGAGEIIIQSIARDGTMEGYNLELIREVSEAVNIPVIASGGCSGYDDMLQAIQAGADAVAAGALFQFSSATPKGAAQYLHEQGIEVRI